MWYLIKGTERDNNNRGKTGCPREGFLSEMIIKRSQPCEKPMKEHSSQKGQHVYIFKEKKRHCGSQ